CGAGRSRRHPSIVRTSGLADDRCFPPLHRRDRGGDPEPADRSGGSAGMSLILASASASRAALLRAAGVAFTVAPADLNEDGLMHSLRANGADAAEIAVRLAAEKALTVSRSNRGALVLGGDTVVAFGDELISKCPDMAAAEALLRRLSGHRHGLVSG